MSQTSPVPRSETCALQGCPIEVGTDEVTGRVRDYCSRTHANMAGARGNLSDNNCKGAAVCKVEDCIALVYRDPVTGVVGVRLYWYTLCYSRWQSKSERLVFLHRGRRAKVYSNAVCWV